MKSKSLLFTNKAALIDLINAYFNYIEGEYHLEKPVRKTVHKAAIPGKKVWDREPEPATIAGLAFYLGFNSRDEFDAYESNGKFAPVIKRACLRIAAAYEKKLDTATGAMFVLKSMGWNKENEAVNAETVKNIKVKIIESGPQPVSSEKEVIL